MRCGQLGAEFELDALRSAGAFDGKPFRTAVGAIGAADDIGDGGQIGLGGETLDVAPFGFGERARIALRLGVMIDRAATPAARFADEDGFALRDFETRGAIADAHAERCGGDDAGDTGRRR